MRQAECDNGQIGVILRYCERLDLAVERFGSTFETFSHDDRVCGMRWHLVHGCEMFDADIVWDAIMTAIPPLRGFT